MFAAIFRAVNDYLNGRLKSRNVHSEIVFSLSPTNNVRSSNTFHERGRSCFQIADSFRRFGLTDTTENLIVVKVSVKTDITHNSVAEHLKEVIDGTPASFDDETIFSFSDIERIRKVYKINTPKSKAPEYANGSFDDGKKETEVAVLGSIALRGAA